MKLCGFVFPPPLPARALCDGLLQGGVTSPLHPHVCSCHMAADSGHQGGCSSSSRAHGCALSLSTLGQGGDAPTPLTHGVAPTGLVATQKLGVSDKEAQSQGVASVPHALRSGTRMWSSRDEPTHWPRRCFPRSRLSPECLQAPRTVAPLTRGFGVMARGGQKHS